MRNRSLAETLVFVSLLFISSLSVRACSGVHVRVRGCSGCVRVPFGSCILGDFWLCSKKQNKWVLSVPKTL